MTRQEIAQLQADVKALETCVQSLVVVLSEKGIITTNEWIDMNHKAHEIKQARDLQ